MPHRCGITSQPVFPAGFEPGLEFEGYARAVQGATGLPPADLATRFESLGNDCEFGFVQRYCKAEVLGLFRFSNPRHDIVLQEIQSGFATYGKAMRVELDRQQPRREWIITDRARRLREHTYIWEGDQPQEDVERLSFKRVRFLRRMMIENLRDGSKIFVIKSGEGHVDHAAASAIADALRAHGPNWLLWVVPGQEVGKIDMLQTGLLRGTIDRLTVQNDGTKPSYGAWLAVMAAAILTLQTRPRPSAAWRRGRAGIHLAK